MNPLQLEPQDLPHSHDPSPNPNPLEPTNSTDMQIESSSSKDSPPSTSNLPIKDSAKNPTAQSEPQQDPVASILQEETRATELDDQ